MARCPKRNNGIFCLEGDWWGDLKRPSSVEPILQLLEKVEPYTPYIHRDVGTREEFEHYLHKWSQSRYVDHPILYLAFHGTPQAIYVGDRRKSESTTSLDEIAEDLSKRCKRRIIHFSSCSALRCDKRHLNRFLQKTGALAVSGYSRDVGWIESAAFEVLLLDKLRRTSLTVHGARRTCREIERACRVLAKDLGFRMVVREAS